MPLGGIGTGSIALAGDGSLRQWQIAGHVNHQASAADSFFAVWARHGRKRPVARVLQSGALYDRPAQDVPPTSTDHVVPEACRRLLARLPGVQDTEFRGAYPIAEVAYRDPALALEVRLEAFSPFIPLQEDDSGLPAIIFNFTLANPTRTGAKASVAATVQNLVGWDGLAEIDGAWSPGFGGNVCSVARLDGLLLSRMTNTGLAPDAPAFGTLALAVRGGSPTYLAGWDDLDAFWKDFSDDGLLAEELSVEPTPPGRTHWSSLAAPLDLGPGQSGTVTFILAWHFPNRIVYWGQRGPPKEAQRPGARIGNSYNRWFASAVEVLDYVRLHFDRLVGDTRLARDTLHATNLPGPLIESVTSQVSALRSPTCFRTEDGRFYGFEGCCGASTAHAKPPVGGCCPLNCTHVWNYEMALARLFPGLERSMREVEWRHQQHETGYLPHRVVLPLDLARPWGARQGGPDRPALDGLLGAVLKTHREYRASGDLEWLRGLWPHLARALEYVWTEHDPRRTGVIENEQPNTYDISIYGANTFIGTLYLAALRAMETMAGLLGQADLARRSRECFDRGSAALDARLFNGEYYVQDVDLAAYPRHNWATGCMTDQLLGQWWAHVLGLGHLLPRDHVRAALRGIVRYNFRRRLAGHRQHPRRFAAAADAGLIVCTWPLGDRPADALPYSDEVWTSHEYEIAALLLWEGDAEPALALLEASRARHDGRRLNPWNDIECGDHYVRAMASWALLEAASGFLYDAGAAEVRFAPALSPEQYQAPFVTRDGWGTFSQGVAGDGRQTDSLALAWGSLELRTLRLRPLGRATACAAEVGGRPMACKFSAAGGEATVAFDPPVTVRADQTLRCVLAAP